MQISTVLILDFGSQYTQLIARRLRELSWYCEVFPFNLSQAKLKDINPAAVILSGSPSSVYGASPPKPSHEVFSLGVPVLGICYGMQVMVDFFGGIVHSSKKREFGHAVLIKDKPSYLLDGIKNLEVWMSHGDAVAKLPTSFSVLAHTHDAPCCVVEDETRRFYGIQFHPEVEHTKEGRKIFKNFLSKICKIKPSWKPSKVLVMQEKYIKNTVGDQKALCAISGGVDSTVAAFLVGKAIGRNLTCLFIDTGLMRKNESSEVKQLLKSLGLKVRFLNESHYFISSLKGIVDPEKKRKIIGRIFIEIFEREIKHEKFLVQGTLYPDVIESVSVGGPSYVIKSHHNVGGLPKKMKLVLIEPFKKLFKDEVRLVGKELGLPSSILNRHPFPGPGLAVRILGEVTKQKLEILREADDILIFELKKRKLYDHVWQAFTVLLPIKTVGIMGDRRSYENAVAIRSVNSTDGMTATWSPLSSDFLASVSSRIINEVKGVNRVLYDISSKPPATIEWE